MDYVIEMAVADRIYDRSNGISGFFLRVVLFLDNAVKELSSRHKFQNYVEVLLSLEDLEHIDYIWMVNLLVRAHLPIFGVRLRCGERCGHPRPFYLYFEISLLLFDYLHSHFLACCLFHDLPHYPK